MNWIIAIAALCGTPAVNTSQSNTDYTAKKVLECQQYYVDCGTYDNIIVYDEVKLSKCIKARQIK